MAHILIIDDEPKILTTLTNILRKDDHDVKAVSDPREVLNLNLSRYEIILTDIMMPELDGFELVRLIRSKTDSPIVFLTAKSEEEDMVFGLGLGADDYIRKPFGIDEIRAKINAHLRREKRERHHTLQFNAISFDLSGRVVYAQGVPLNFTKSEYEICELLARHPGTVFSRDQILEATLGWDSESSASTISVHVGNIRAKFEAYGVEPIATVWGVGYKWLV